MSDMEDLADSGFDPHVLPNEYLTNPKSNHTFVYVCTIQRMMINLFGRQGMFAWTEEDEYEDDVDQLDIPVHAFDFVIADECHRDYTAGEESKWREVLNHFDAVKIGITATPAKHTTAYFREVVYHYPVAKAVQEGYLVDWDFVRIDSDIRMTGLFPILTKAFNGELVPQDPNDEPVSVLLERIKSERKKKSGVTKFNEFHDNLKQMTLN